MPIPQAPKSEERQGDLVVRRKSKNKIECLYRPRQKMADAAGVKLGVSEKIIEVNLSDKTLNIYPLNTLPTRDDFLQPKYGRVKRISLLLSDDVCEDLRSVTSLNDERILSLLKEELPPGFTHDPDYGLGLAREYKDIIDSIKEHSSCSGVFMGFECETSDDIKAGVFNLNLADYDSARKALNNITSLGQVAAAEVKDGVVYNMIADRLGVAKKAIRVGRSPVRRIITAAAQGKSVLAEGDQDIVVDLLKAHGREVEARRPGAISKLQSEIELVALDVLIFRFEEMLKKVTVESEWQNFFRENSFILTMVFGYPVVEVLEQGSVGGGQLTGGGGKFSDFIARNSQTNNAAIFEIKTPSTQLLNKSAFRGKVFAPTSEFSGSIVQVLDQRYHLVRNLPLLKSNERGLQLETYAVHCCLIIGSTPEGVDEQKSFEIFRRNSSGVEIVTFDELLVKLRQLHEFLQSR